ncbi:hypothetical protein J6TS7_21570 [Paenibacillus dendritiformis]|nr:hypothetical protein J6TS7_21570 [Paenibacillus dendritiformis]
MTAVQNTKVSASSGQTLKKSDSHNPYLPLDKRLERQSMGNIQQGGKNYRERAIRLGWVSRNPQVSLNSQQ